MFREKGVDEGLATRFCHFGVAPGAAMDEAEELVC